MGSTEPLGPPLPGARSGGDESEGAGGAERDERGRTQAGDMNHAERHSTQADVTSEGPWPLPDLPPSLLLGYLEAAILVVRTTAPHELPRALRPYRNWTARGLRRPPVLLQLRRSLEEDANFRDMVDTRVLAAQKDLAGALREGRCEEVGHDTEPLVLAAVGIALGSQGVCAVDAAARSAQPQLESTATPSAERGGAQRVERLEGLVRDLRRRVKDARDAQREHDREMRQLRARLHAAQERGLEMHAELAVQREAADRERAQLGAQLREERRLRLAAERRLIEVQRLRPPQEVVAEATGAFQEVERALVRLGEQIRRVGAGAKESDPDLAIEVHRDGDGKTAAPWPAGERRSQQPITSPYRSRQTFSQAAHQGRSEASNPESGQASKKQTASAGPGAERRADVVRHPLAVPFGRLQEDPETLHAWASTTATIVLVDGYNVTLHPQGFSGLALAQQRTLLVERCDRLVGATGAEVVVVFDGAQVGSIPHRMASGRARIVFTEAGRTADDEIVALVRRAPVERPVVVVSTDNEVRARCRALGASTVPSAALLRWDRR